MTDEKWHERTFRVKRCTATLLVLAMSGSALAQNRIEVPNGMPGIGAAASSLRSDLDKLNAYNQSVEEKIRPERRNARDPFQTTPELRSRSGRAGFAPSAIGPGGYEEGPIWRVQALALSQGGASAYAVLVRGATASRGKEMEAEAMRQRFVRLGDTFEVSDGRLFKVLKIDRQGVWLRSEGVEEEEMRIQ